MHASERGEGESTHAIDMVTLHRSAHLLAADDVCGLVSDSDNIRPVLAHLLAPALVALIPK